MGALFVMTLLAALVLPPVAFAEVQTFSATHTYTLGDDDSRNTARQKCLAEAKRKILEQAGVYIESVSEVKDLQLTKDKITSFAAAVMQVKDTKEEVGFQQGHMTMMLTLKADVDLAEVRKQLAARQVDAGVRDDVATQKERLKRLEAQLEAMQQQQGGRSSGSATVFPPIDISVEEPQSLQTQAARGDAKAQVSLGRLYDKGKGVPQDYATARGWYEKAAAQGNASAQSNLGMMYHFGHGVPQDYAIARQWFEKAAAQGNAIAQFSIGRLYYNGLGVPKDYAIARHWYEEAAAQGEAIAQFGIGWLYYNGHGVPQDDMRTYMWWNLAVANTKSDELKSVAKLRGDIARDMTPAQVAEAQRLGQQCQTQKFKGC